MTKRRFRKKKVFLKLTVIIILRNNHLRVKSVCIRSYSRMLENADQNNSEYGPFHAVHILTKAITFPESTLKIKVMLYWTFF